MAGDALLVRHHVADSGLSFCYLTNGRDVNPIREGRRSIGISSRAAVCAG